MTGAGPPIVIVGAGDCGTRAAFTLREQGWDGPVILIGSEPSLPYERPPLSTTWQLTLSCDDDALRAAGITLLAGTDATTLVTTAHVLGLSGGRQLEYRSLLLATGARARRLPLRGAWVHLLRTHADAVALGCAVTVVELAPRLMGRAVPARIAATMAKRHVAAGIDVRFGTAVTGLADSAGVTITLAEGGSVQADVVIAGVGAEPETALAKAAGIEVGDGIVVDPRSRTRLRWLIRRCR